MARVALPQSKIRARRRRRRLTIFFVCIAGALFFATMLVWSFHASFWRISSVHVSGVKTVATSTVADYVTKRLDGEFAFVIPKNNILFYPKRYIRDLLLKDLPVLAEVRIHADSFNTISVEVTERQPKALWCGADVTSAVPCFLVDEDGVVYAAALTLSGNVHTKYYGALLGTTTPKQFVTSAEFRSVSALVETIAAHQKNDQLVSVSIDSHKDVRMRFASNFELLFGISVDAGDLYERFTLALQSDPFRQHAIGDFEYLDLRFGDKLYYKLKE